MIHVLAFAALIIIAAGLPLGVFSSGAWLPRGNRKRSST